MTTLPDKPQPTIDVISEPFWTALREHRFLIQRCAQCDTPRFPAAPICTQCWSAEANWIAASGRGNVYTYTIMYRAGMPAFAADVPYAIVIVDLEESVHVMSHLVHVDLENADTGHSIHIGMPVHLVYEDADNELTLYRFEPSA